MIDSSFDGHRKVRICPHCSTTDDDNPAYQRSFIDGGQLACEQCFTVDDDSPPMKQRTRQQYEQRRQNRLQSNNSDVYDRYDNSGNIRLFGAYNPRQWTGDYAFDTAADDDDGLTTHHVRDWSSFRSSTEQR